MNDRELLEMAAKAAGICGHYACHHPQFDNDWEEPGIWFVDKNDCTSCWNPLTDDGDALRLAVRMRMCVNIWKYFVDADGEVVDHQNDPYTSTRLAIVLAAADIGKEMK